MFKFLMITLVIFSCSLVANEDDMQLDQIAKCDKVYDDCSLRCEKETDTNNEMCYAKCEALFDACQNESENLEDKQN